MVSDLVSIWNIRTSERSYTVNYDVKEWVSSLPFSKPEIEILPHGIDVPELLRQTEQSVGSTSEHKFILCYVGSFKDYHCLQPLIQAISRLREDDYDVGLSLVGTGPELNSIRKAVEQHEISSATTFHGFVDPSKVPKYIRSADASYGVIDPERTGSPMKVYEYLANGTPVIATSGEEFDFIEKEQIGVLIEEPTSKAVVNAIKAIYNIPESERSEMEDRVRDVGYKNGVTWAEFANRVITE
ncbi:glycosyltransferase [Halorubrum ezzemoulense]|uniref:Glycosyltransferase n=1 Tax=Halorubrum ezzemoulense TaxID=337243 RepID=A0ABT4Z833_HALEZ|nr:glycosyltransferase [Halorubrum ezzemoulense]MDB2294117.1 glycosyltransferase [Halorubrum ezzemoulense]